MSESLNEPLTHVDSAGRAQMVDVGQKPITARYAVAEALLHGSPELLTALRDHRLEKGQAFAVARVAGIMAAKRTAELIPLCHTVPLDVVSVKFQLRADAVVIRAEISCHSRTGIEMEALAAAAVAGLTLIDMGKAVDRFAQIDSLRVVRKSGGRSGTHEAPSDYIEGQPDA